ncbi:MAG TPA: hypothetical protein DEB40_05320 [Elusimicrobia bacterium]|nr:hypothetical protein [Elusimicrobiota bacterium]HBT61145.1 hypothetical protein [Elusimicrobiota bacterium]
MKRGAGLWIDHRKAVIVFISDEEQALVEIRSNVEKQLRPLGGERSQTQYGPQQAPADDMRETVFMGHLAVYFEKVVSCLREEPAIFIFGPGEAKGELKKRLEKDKLGGRVVAVETADKMTDNQIAAKVRKQFLVPA